MSAIKFGLFFFLGFVVAGSLQASLENHLIGKRDAQTEPPIDYYDPYAPQPTTTTEEPKIEGLVLVEIKDCDKHAPCGWGVYHKYDRTIDYFMRNSCVCPKTKKCLRVEDDIVVMAFVYRCRNLGDKDLIR